MSCARSAFNALEPHDNSETGYKEFAGALEKRATRQMQLTNCHRLGAICCKLSAERCVAWQYLVAMVQKIARNTLWQIGQRWEK